MGAAKLGLGRQEEVADPALLENALGGRAAGSQRGPALGAVEAKMRSTRAPQEAVAFIRDGEVYVTLIAGETGIAPGQACVLYSDDSADAQVLGGGFIAETVPAARVA